MSWLTGDVVDIVVAVIQAIVIMLVAVVVGAFMSFVERRMLGLWQDRYGPNRVGPFGLFQLGADMLKMFFKEDWIPPFADKRLFVLAPMVSMGTIILAFMVIPITPTWGVADLNGDVVARGAFGDSLARTGVGGVRMLHQHEARAVVGVWDEMIEDERGLLVRGRIEDWSAEARFAAALSRAGALDGLSIGFRAAKARRGGRLRVLTQVELWEVSLVTFPMLPGARFSVAFSG